MRAMARGDPHTLATLGQWQTAAPVSPLPRPQLVRANFGEDPEVYRSTTPVTFWSCF